MIFRFLSKIDRVKICWKTGDARYAVNKQIIRICILIQPNKL